MSTMKRDFDLVRDILIQAEQCEDVLDGEILVTNERSAELIAYHLEMMRDYGLIDVKIEYAMGGHPLNMIVKKITWHGYDYLDAIRSKKIWNKAKKMINETVGEASLSIIKDTCLLLVKQAIQLNFN